MNGWRTFVPVTKVTSTKIVQYSYCLDAVKSPKSREIQEKNLSRGTYNGFLSPKTKSALREKLSNWMLAGAMYRKTAKGKPGYSPPYFTFATLTLPAKQLHSDNEIKRKCLNMLLILLQRNFKVVNYFWRAEPQKNGNVHFHLIIDRYIQNAQLQKHWNNCLSALGYIDRFSAVFGHRQPPSTHIVKLSGKNAAIKYLSKYLSKDQERRKIAGRIWGSSDKVKGFASVAMETTVLHNDLVQAVAIQKDSFRVVSTYVGAVFGNVYAECEKNHKELWREIVAGLVRQYEYCYVFDSMAEKRDETPVNTIQKTVTKAVQYSINYCYSSLKTVTV